MIPSDHAAADAPLSDCGCCRGIGDLTPASVENRPGLSALCYRVGTHWSFKRTMLARATREARLRHLTNREDDDPSIALIDAWAAVLDVLTFYQERIANEGYLLTATEIRSVYDLAAQIGYQPSPGVAASTYLAFELETAAGAPPSVRIPLATRVQSVPGPDETPQTFETVEELDARPQLNRLNPQLSERRVPGMGDTEAWLDGIATGLKRGDAIVFVGKERLDDPASDRWDLRLVASVEPDADRQVTRVTWAEGLGWAGPGGTVEPAKVDVRCFALRQRASLFGHNAPDWRAMPATVRCAYGDANLNLTEWPGFTISSIAAGAPSPSTTVFLDAVYPKVVPGSWLALQSPSTVELYRPDPTGGGAIAEDSRTNFTLTSKCTRVTLEGENLGLFETHIRDTVVFLDSEELALAEARLGDPVQGREIRLEGTVPGLDKGRRVLVVGPRPRVSVAEGAHLSLDTGDGPVALGPRDVLTVTAPFVDTPSGVRTWTLQTADGRVGTVTAPATDPRLVPVPAAPTDSVLVEPALVEEAMDAAADPGRTVLRLASPLKGTFDRFSARVAANVALATHGESRTEILGDGDASRPFPSFTLKGSPLTYVPSSAPSGGTTTLTVRIDDVAWQEVPALYPRSGRDPVYAVGVADDATVTVQFGDGRSGARLPTGRENVSAHYRAGTGAKGNLKSGQLSLLMTRPLGVRSVTNPMASTGGADPESRDEARVNAPRAVLTFDRVVSLADFEDFARSFAGIAKARATWLWQGRARLVHLTVAGAGAGVGLEAVLKHDLATAIRDAGDPHREFRIDGYDPLTFDIGAGLFLRAGYEWEKVKAAAEASVRLAFSFDRRELAQSVTASEVIAVLQSVAGVLAVDFDLGDFHVTGEAPPTDPILRARGARTSAGGVEPAQLLIVNPAASGVTIGRRQ